MCPQICRDLFTVMMSSRCPGSTSTPGTAPALNLRVCVEECGLSTVSALPPPNLSLLNVNVDCDMSMWQLELFFTSMTSPGAPVGLLRGAGSGEELCNGEEERSVRAPERADSGELEVVGDDGEDVPARGRGLVPGPSTSSSTSQSTQSSDVASASRPSSLHSASRSSEPSSASLSPSTSTLVVARAGARLAADLRHDLELCTRKQGAHTVMITHGTLQWAHCTNELKKARAQKGSILLTML